MIFVPVEEGPQQRGEHDADRVVAAEQGDRDAGEAQTADRSGVRVLAPEQLGQADQAGHPPEISIVEMHHALGVDAAGDGRGPGSAGGAQVEAEPGPAEQEPVADADQAATR